MYSIVYEKSAIKDLVGVEKPFRLLIKEKIEILAKDPNRLKNRIKALKGKEYKGLYRLRVGDYRVVYQRKDDVLIILIVRIGHRKEVY
ncbi:type II toxin-antitoxin system RelE family toxin [Hydrogenimonas sp.]